MRAFYLGNSVHVCAVDAVYGVEEANIESVRVWLAGRNERRRREQIQIEVDVAYQSMELNGPSLIDGYGTLKYSKYPEYNHICHQRRGPEYHKLPSMFPKLALLLFTPVS